MGGGGEGVRGIFTIQTSVKLYLQLVLNKSLSNLAIVLILRCSFQWCRRIFPNLFMSKVKKKTVKRSILFQTM